MSDIGQVQAALTRLFVEETQRIVFWNDPDREFEGMLADLSLDDVTTLRLDEFGALEVKIRVDRTEPEAKFLLYSPAEEPECKDDWLLDVRLYSRSFRADRASIHLQELGLADLAMRTHLAERRKFFDAKDRVQKLRALVEPKDTAADLDRKMIAVVVKAEQPEFFAILRTLFHAWGSRASISTWTRLRRPGRSSRNSILKSPSGAWRFRRSVTKTPIPRSGSSSCTCS